jgi:hypothetical protein
MHGSVPFGTVTTANRRLSRVAPLVLVLTLATACGDNDKSAGTPTQPPRATTGGGRTIPAPTGTDTDTDTETAGTGTLVGASRDLLPLLGGSIQRFAPTQVEGKSLRIVALAGADSFWAGRSESQRILVKLRLKGSSPPKIELGQKVDFIGILTASGADADSLGLRSEADKALLETQGAYANPSVADVKLG